jgi:enoyl-CoA hydratase/carnithine racemase
VDWRDADHVFRFARRLRRTRRRSCHRGHRGRTRFLRRGRHAAPAGEHGISWILPRLIGPARALDLLLSGRVILGEEAAALGLVNAALADERLLEHSLAYARELATQSSPASMATMKRQIYADLDRGPAEALEKANQLMFASFAAPDFAEGVSSFVERRAPRFAPLTEVPSR